MLYVVFTVEGVERLFLLDGIVLYGIIFELNCQNFLNFLIILIVFKIFYFLCCSKSIRKNLRNECVLIE